MATVTAPVAGYTGTSVCGVAFTDGVAETDNPAALRYFEAAGFAVSAKAAPKKAPAKPAAASTDK